MIDVSDYQGNIDWKAVKTAGVDGAIIKCGFGSDYDFQDDKCFEQNVKGCIEVGIPFGVYLYSYAYDEAMAKSEAAHVLRLIEPYKDKISLPVYIDLEEKSCRHAYALVASVFCNAIKAAGYKAGVYTGISAWNDIKNKVGSVSVWIAYWGNNDGSVPSDGVGFPVDLWQYTDKGRVSGIVGNVDMDIAYFEPAPTPQPDPTPDFSKYAIRYRVCVDDVWQEWVGDGETAGTQGQAKAFEAVQVEGGYGQDITVSYQLNVETNGDLAISSMGAVCGTEGLDRGAKAMRIWATGKEIEIRGYCQKTGWTPWVEYGKWVGTPNGNMRLEAIQIRIKKGGSK